MLNQNLCADKHKNHAAGNLRLGLVAHAEDAADLDTQHGNHAGGHADETYRQDDIRVRQEGKVDAHGQRVNAGGDGQEQHGLEAQ